MSEEKEVLNKVASYLKSEEWALCFNGIGSIPVQLNDPMAGTMQMVREKIKVVHEKSLELEGKTNPNAKKA